MSRTFKSLLQEIIAEEASQVRVARSAPVRLRDDLHQRPWAWLGMTRQRWRDTPFRERVLLF